MWNIAGERAVSQRRHTRFGGNDTAVAHVEHRLQSGEPMHQL